MLCLFAKFHPKFPDEILNHYIYEKTKDADLKLDVSIASDMAYIKKCLHYAACIIVVYVLYMVFV